MLEARVIGEDHIIARAVAEEADNAGMRAVENFYDAAFCALTVGVSGALLEFGDDAITVHRVVNGEAGDENVAIEFGNGFIGDYEAVAIVMEDQTTANFVGSEGLVFAALVRFLAPGLLMLLGIFGMAMLGAIARLGVFATREAVATAGEFVNGTAFFEITKHFEEGAGVGFFEVEGTGDVVGGRRSGRNLQKTQDIVGIEVRGSRHGQGQAFGDANFSQRFYAIFEGRL